MNYIILFVLFFLSILTGCTTSESVATWEIVKFVSVVDWDTIKIERNWVNINVRVLWIDTPEKYTIKKWYIECYGRESSQRAKVFFSWATQVTLIKDSKSPDSDRYGRLLRYVEVSSVDYSTVALLNWLWFFMSWSSLDNYDVLKASENIAKQKNVWVWKECGGTYKKL